MRTRKRKKRFARVLIILLILASACLIAAVQNGAAFSDLLAFSSFQDEAGGDWNLILVNNENHVPDGFVQNLTVLSNGERVESRIYPQLQKMFDAARADGVYMTVASGYRTEKTQQRLMTEKIQAYRAEGYSSRQAKKLAEKWVAKPGASEHQLGIAVDINEKKGMSEAQEVYGWLDENAFKFGFIKRYPADKADITGIGSEPWHYRYVGTEAAEEIYNRGVCLEEYIEQSK